MIKRIVLIMVLLLSYCSAMAANPVAIPMEYYVIESRSKRIIISAFSDNITFNTHDYMDYPDIAWSTRYKTYRVGDGAAAITTWTIKSIPAHGNLYEDTTLLGIDDTITDPDALLYIPTPAYTGDDAFSFQVADSIGSSNIAVVDLIIEAPENYTPPLGIEAPGFGIADEPPADPSNWPGAEETGWYYIDKDHASCDDNNDYGCPDVPRCNIPSSVSVVEGGKMVLIPATTAYELRDSTWQRFTLDGAEGNTSWLVGCNDCTEQPIITSHQNRIHEDIRLEGNFAVVDGIEFNDVKISFAGESSVGENLTIRHCEIRDMINNGNGAATTMNGALINSLYFDVSIHDNGSINEDLSKEVDYHGIQVSDVNNLWILDSCMWENAGDSIQVKSLVGEVSSANNIYVGRIKSHSEGENTVDVKGFDTIIVSECDSWDLRRVIYGNSKGLSQNFYINDEGVQLGSAWFINNRAWDSGGTGLGSAAIGYITVYITGNLTSWTYDGIWQFQHIYPPNQLYMTNNTLIEYRRYGINVSTSTYDETYPKTKTYIDGNFFDGADESTWDIYAHGGDTNDTGSFESCY